MFSCAMDQGKGRGKSKRNKQSPSRIPLESHGNLRSSERVYREIKESIVSGELAPGSRLVELSLADQFGVSRTPVREALKRLLTEGLVMVDPSHGMIVRGINQQEVEQIYMIREVLDGLAARLATDRVSAENLARLNSLMEIMSTAVEQHNEEALVQANIRFHETMYQASQNDRLTELGRGLNDFIRRFSRTAFRSYERDKEVLEEHQAIIQALKRRDPEAAERLAREHMRKARSFLAHSSVMEEFASEDVPARD